MTLALLLLVLRPFGPPPDLETVLDSPPPASRAEATGPRFSVPLTDGRFELRELIAGLCEVAELGPGHPLRLGLQQLDWNIDVRSALGQRQLDALNGLTGDSLRLEVTADRLSVTVDETYLRRLRGEIDQLPDMLPGALPSTWRTVLTGVTSPPEPGLWSVQTDRSAVPFAALDEVPRHVVLLVHGLDDPGIAWNDLIPALLEEGYDVAYFNYPPEVSISDAADLLALQLLEMRIAGVRNVDIVAHSMGGLVSRDVLTRRAYYNGDGSDSNRLPAVDRLIMLGTPNHGSQMARLRVLTNLVRGMENGEGSISAGEAANDLLPGSEFLERLNRRPHPAHTRYTVVAARLIGVDTPAVVDAEPESEERNDAEAGSSWFNRWLGPEGRRRLAATVAGAVNGVGDGLVSVESTQLEGVDDQVVVEANHMGMIVNLFPTRRTPPAIPIVLDRLK